MATEARVLKLGETAPRTVGRSLLLTLPIAIWSFLMFSHSGQPGRSGKIATIVTAIFMITLFFMMMRTWSTYRWRRWFFVALGLLFPVGFIHNVMVMRGTMGIPDRGDDCWPDTILLPAHSPADFAGSIYQNAGIPRFNLA